MKAATLFPCLLGAPWAAARPHDGQRHACNSPTARWTDLAPIAGGVARQEHSTVVLGDDSIYIVGGIPANATNSDASVPSIGALDVYSIRANAWRCLPPLPVPMNHPNAAAVDGRVYVLGGLTGDASGPDHTWRAVPDCFSFDPATGRWTMLAPMAAADARGSAAVGVLDGKAYLAGGVRSLSLVPGGLQDSVDTVTAYDVAAATWTRLPALPSPRDHTGSAVIGRTFYVVGGRERGQHNLRNSTFALDLDSPAAWQSRAPMPTARGGLCAGHVRAGPPGAAGDVIVAFGGEGDPRQPLGRLQPDRGLPRRARRLGSPAAHAAPAPRHRCPPRSATASTSPAEAPSRAPDP